VGRAGVTTASHPYTSNAKEFLILVIRERFSHDLADTTEAVGIAQLAIGAVIPFAGQVLLLKRRTDGHTDIGRWELPNGTVEPGEFLGEALIRVVKQQTGLNVVAVRSHLGSSDHVSASGQQVRQYNFVAEVVPTDEVKLAEHETYAWADLRKDLLPARAADQAVLSNLRIGLTG